MPFHEVLTHPDCLLRKCQGKLAFHTIESIRFIIQELSYQGYSSKKRVVVIYDAERMLPSSSNALLKTLEEPSEGTLIILTTSKLGKILPTIRSRAQIIRVPHTGLEAHIDREKNLPESYDKLLSSFWNGIEIVDLINEISSKIEKDAHELVQARKVQIRNSLENISKTQQYEIESEIEAIKSQYIQDIGNQILSSLWVKYRDAWIKNPTLNIFQKEFTSPNGRFFQAQKALERGSSIASALFVLCA